MAEEQQNETTETTDTQQGEGSGEELTAQEIADMAKEMGITTGQLKGRLEASRKWEERAKKAPDPDEVQRLRDAAQRLDEIEDAKKSEQERLQEQLEAAKAEGTQASARLERLDVALDKAPDGMPLAKVRKLADRLTGTNREELEADADELFADFAPAEPEPGTGNGRPKERLKPGASNADSEDQLDPKKIADAVRGSGF